jgi:hypothetical protein
MEPELVAEFVRMGVPREQLPRTAAAPGVRAAGPLLARHLNNAVRLAMALRSQKRAVQGMDGLVVLGLDYGPLEGMKRTLRLPMRGRRAERLHAQFRICEREMVSIWNRHEDEAALAPHPGGVA